MCDYSSAERKVLVLLKWARSCELSTSIPAQLDLLRQKIPRRRFAFFREQNLLLQRR